jgi:hypothetical protein
MTQNNNDDSNNLISAVVPFDSDMEVSPTTSTKVADLGGSNAPTPAAQLLNHLLESDPRSFLAQAASNSAAAVAFTSSSSSKFWNATRTNENITPASIPVRRQTYSPTVATSSLFSQQPSMVVSPSFVASSQQQKKDATEQIVDNLIGEIKEIQLMVMCLLFCP